MVTWADSNALDYYAVKVDNGKERMAVDILENRKILAKVPIATTQEVQKANRRVPAKVVERKSLLLVGLVFVAFPIGYEIPWFALKQRIHVIRGVLGADHQPRKFDDHDKAALLRLFDNIVFTDAQIAAHKRVYYLGEKVRVTLGPFAGFEAEVMDPTPGDLRVLCDIFGRKVPVRIEAGQLDKIQAVAA